MRFSDREIQEHLLAGGSIQRKGWDESIYFNQGYLIYNCGAAYLLNERDLKANDWEVIDDNNSENYHSKMTWKQFKEWVRSYKNKIYYEESQNGEVLRIGNLLIDSKGNISAIGNEIELSKNLSYNEMRVIIEFLCDGILR